MADGRFLSCPRCAKNDQIRKVSTVVREGTAGGSTAYGSVTTRSNLAAALTMPSPAQMSSSLGGTIGCGIGIAFIVWVVVGTIVGAIFAVALHLAWIAAIFDILLAGGLVVWIISAVKSHSAEKAEVDAQNRLYPAMERVWNSLYYCFRDDIVFCEYAPHSSAPSSEMVRLLVDESGRQALDA
jgi:hypothetical protein